MAKWTYKKQNCFKVHVNIPINIKLGHRYGEWQRKEGYVNFISVKLPYFAIARWKNKKNENGIVQAYFKILKKVLSIPTDL